MIGGMNKDRSKVAVVTGVVGGNRTIGYGIALGLCKAFDGFIYITGRSWALVENATNLIKATNECLAPHKIRYHQLDIWNDRNIEHLHNHLRYEHGGLDILINNEAIYFKHDSPKPLQTQTEVTMRFNYFSLISFCHIMFRILRPNSRVVNIIGPQALLKNIHGEELRHKLMDESMTEEQLTNLMDNYVRLFLLRRHMEAGFHDDPYVVSMVGKAKLSFIQQRHFDKNPNKRGIIVNAVHPGFVARRTQFKNRAPIMAALLPPDIRHSKDEPVLINPKGQLIWFNCSVMEWDQACLWIHKIPHNATMQAWESKWIKPGNSSVLAAENKMIREKIYEAKRREEEEREKRGPDRTRWSQRSGEQQQRYQQQSYRQQQPYQQQPPYQQRYQQQPPYQQRYQQQQPPYQQRYQQQPPYQQRYQQQPPYEQRYQQQPPYEQRYQQQPPYEQRYQQEQEPQQEEPQEEEQPQQQHDRRPSRGKWSKRRGGNEYDERRTTRTKQKRRRHRQEEEDDEYYSMEDDVITEKMKSRKEIAEERKAEEERKEKLKAVLKDIKARALSLKRW